MYKKKYTSEDIHEIAEWFKRHATEMPDTLQLDAATFYCDLKKTVESYFSIFEIHGSNPTFSGQLHQLFLIRKRLEDMGIKDAQ